MAQHPWVAASDSIRWGLQTVIPNDRGALARLLKTGRQMEALGYDSMFVMDHPALHADPWIALSSVAAVTERLRLGQLVMAAGYRHPAYVARLQADLDNLSDGRSILGIGSGWFEAEYDMMALPFPSIKERQAGLDEAIKIIDGVWGPEPYTYKGQHFEVHGMQVEPPPARRPPVLVGGSGERVTLRQVAAWGDACNLRESVPTSAGVDRDPDRFAEVRRKFEALAGHCRDLDRPVDDVLRTHFTTYLVMAPNQAAADAKADAIDTSKSTSAGARSGGRNFILAASPERAISYYQGMKQAGARYFVVQVDADDDETIALLAERVMPALAS